MPCYEPGRFVPNSVAMAILPDLLDPPRLRGELASLPAPDAALPTLLLERMRAMLRVGRASVRARFEAGEGAEMVHRELARQMDAMVQGALDFAERRHYGSSNPTTGERLAVLAAGGYGRAELAPGSDIDLLILCPYKRTPLIEQMAEFLLYRLWDLGLRVGQATRSISECVKLARSDLSVKTALLEARFLWGSRDLFDQLQAEFRRQVIDGGGPDFVDAKLAERDARHQRLGDSRFLLEPNLKEGKGGLRDIHTLEWIARFLHGTRDPAELVRIGFLSRSSAVTLVRAKRFLWAVRCHLHYQTGRAEDRLTFDLQPEVARLLGYRGRNRERAVERFMKRYYLVARDVGALTRAVVAGLEETQQRRPRFVFPRLGIGRRRVNGFQIHGNRVALAEPDLFAREPTRMLELFHITQERGLDIHPSAWAAVATGLPRINHVVRSDPEANRLFLDILTSRSNPALTLGRMSESGLLGRFVPEFGRTVGQMQHNLYHVYTVDEHTVRVIDGLGQIERGELAQELPLATEIMPKILSRRELFVAALLHDLGKGRAQPHSEFGEALAKRLCPRFGLSQDATETVAWLVRHHLVMSHFAFRRDTEDPQTITDFVAVVQSPERLRLLVLLTVADIRAVGPGVWNGWKGQLLRELYFEAAAAMATGDVQGRRAHRIEAAKAQLGAALKALPEEGWTPDLVTAHLARHDPRYWLGFSAERQVGHARIVRAADAARAPVALDFRVDEFRDRTELLLYAADHPGLFMKVAGALALSGASIVDAHIFTTTDGMALDMLGFQEAATRQAVAAPEQLERIRETIVKALGGEIWLERALEGRRSLPIRADVFQVEPRVLVDNGASRTHSVIEVNGRDRPGLLFALAKTLKDLGLVIHSAHISTYGERVVDVFYVKDVFGLKITHRSKLQRVNRQLTEVLGGR